MGFLNKMKTAMGGDDPALMASGLLGRGEIMDVQITGGSVQHGGAPPEQICVFEVMVYLDDAQPFTAQVRKRIPMYALANIQAGQTVVAVRVDPNDHSRVGIDFAIEAPVVRLARKPGATSAQDVLDQGRPCEVVIIEFLPLNVKNQAGLDMYAFLLTVMVPARVPYQIKVGNPVLAEAVPLIYPGSKLPAKYMPDAAPEELVIDWKAALANYSSG
jgi:hypothetical protein